MRGGWWVEKGRYAGAARTRVRVRVHGAGRSECHGRASWAAARGGSLGGIARVESARAG